MDRLLRPKTFETETRDPNFEKLYKHWKVTFENYVEEFIPAPAPATSGDATGIATHAAAVTSVARKKKLALINNVSANVYELISDSATFEDGMQALDAAYLRPKSVVYNRHKLITSKQDAGQSIDTYLQNLQSLAKDCNFVAVTAEQSKNQYIRDAFINGIASASIRQRLLENSGNLTLEEASTQARALEQAQSQSASYENSGSVAAMANVEEDDSDTLAATGYQNKLRNNNNNGTGNKNGNKNNFKISSKNEKCYFCNQPRHQRSVCPARNDVCNGCGKKGHWAKVCRSTNSVLGAVGRVHVHNIPSTQHLSHTQHFSSSPPHSQHNFPSLA